MQEQPDQTGLTLGLWKMTALIHMTGFPVKKLVVPSTVRHFAT